jgi:hypothetical protein
MISSEGLFRRDLALSGTPNTSNSNTSENDITEDYDLVVLRSGSGGKLLSWTLAARRQRVAVVERRYVGGSCPNIACLPSKNVVHSAKVASYLRREEIGVRGGSIDMAAVRARKRKMVDGLVAIHLQKYRSSGAELIMGSGHFVGPRTLEVALNAGGTRTLRRANVVINTGSRARLDETPGLADSQPLTHVEALELDRTPEHLVVLGGGYVSLEPAQALRCLGSRVTVVERNGALIHREDADVTEAIEQLFRTRGSKSGPRRQSKESKGGRENLSDLPPAAEGSSGRICSSPAGALRTQTGSGWRMPGSRSTGMATSRSTSGGRRPPRASGPSATARVARTSRTSPPTTSASFWKSSTAGTG